MGPLRAERCCCTVLLRSQQYPAQRSHISHAHAPTPCCPLPQPATAVRPRPSPPSPCPPPLTCGVQEVPEEAAPRLLRPHLAPLAGSARGVQVHKQLVQVWWQLAVGSRQLTSSWHGQMVAAAGRQAKLGSMCVCVGGSTWSSAYWLPPPSRALPRQLHTLAVQAPLPNAPMHPVHGCPI